tara:strand:+ start:125 stop:4285 length:4161 start_codon:yes stop_codon:yes gene_type:complete
MLPHHGAPEAKIHSAASNRANTPLFVLSFIFLTVVLSFQSWQQWQNARHAYDIDVERTLDHYKRQSELIIKAGLHANQIFTRSYGDQLEVYAKRPEAADTDDLWGHVSAAIFNATGFFVTDQNGKVLNHYGSLLSPNEPSDIENELRSQGLDKAIFSLRYSHLGGYYVGTRFNTSDGPMIMVSRRAYSHLSEIIFRGGFNGFEMVLYDRRDNTVSIREQFYSDTQHPTLLTESETGNILYRDSIPMSPWDILALPIQGYWKQQFIESIRIPATFLIVFAILLIVLRRYLSQQGEAVVALQKATEDTERRADRVLRSIDEAFISTDHEGHIDYLNPKALSLLGRTEPDPVLGMSLEDIWTAPDALWNRGLAPEAIESLKPDQRVMHVQHADGKHILEQKMQLLYDNKQVSGYVWLLRDITESEQAKAALEHSRTRYKALFEEAGIAHGLLDLSEFDGTADTLKVVSVNEATLQLGDFDTLEAMGAHYQRHPESLTPLLKALTSSKSLRLQQNECELTLRDRSGRPIDIWASISFRTSSSHQVLLTMLDITERKQATEKIREREAFWMHVMEAMPDVVYVLDVNDRLEQKTIFSNRHVAQLLGFPDSREYIERSWMDYVIEDDLARCRDGLRNIRNSINGQTIETTARFLNADGEIRVLKFRDTPFTYDSDGKVERYIGTGRDVTADIEKQEQIVESERRYRLLAENMNDIVWATDAQLNFNFVSTSVQRLLGYQPEDLVNGGVTRIFSRPDLKRLGKALQHQIQIAINSPETAKRRSTVIREDFYASASNGSRVLLELQASLLWNDKDELQGLLGICRDVTESRSIEQELQLAAEVFENSNEAILITDQKLKIANTNRAFQHITGYSAEDVTGKTPDFLISSEQYEEDLIEKIGERLMVDGYWQGEISYQRRQGDIRTGWAGVSAIRDQNREVQSLIIIMSDITERKASEERIHKLAYYDPLTALPNRSQMHETLDGMLKRARKQGLWVVLLFIDLDRFKPINDSMGHPAGDEVLKQVAGRLRNCVKHRDLVCRMGGDEFTIAIADQPSHNAASDTAIMVAERILESLHQSFNLNQREVFISASIGISIYPNDGNSVIELLKNADMAMYHAKDMGRDNMQFFTASMNRKAVQLLELENDLRHALARNEMQLYFQTQYRTDSEKAVGVEVLLRWIHPTRGMISPGTFIPIIEDTGLIVPIGQWVLEESCRCFVRWQAEEELGLERIAVNVSARQFRSEDFLNVVKDIIIRTGIRPEQLELELTESILMEDVELAMETLRGLRAAGVKTAIDDFGTGYSSLNYLKQFPVDTLKIDRSFIQNLPENADDAQISRTIIAMGHNLGMGIIAEGVETAEQLTFLQMAKCEEVQGFYFSKPVDEASLIEDLGKS